MSLASAVVIGFLGAGGLLQADTVFLTSEGKLRVPFAQPSLREVSAVVASEGCTWVVDPVLATVLEFDTSGAFRRGHGNERGGVGEFAWPVLAGYHERRLWVWDQRLRRVTMLGDSLQTLSSFETRDGYTAAMADDGFLITYPYVIDRPQVPVLRTTISGGVLDTIGFVRPGRGWMTVAAASAYARIRQPFESQDLWSIDPSGRGIVIAVLSQGRSGGGDSVRVVRLAAGGDTLFDVSISVPTVRLTQSIVESKAREILTRLMASAASRGETLPEGVLEGIASQLETPEFIPLLSAVQIDMDDRTWLETPSAPGVDRYLRWVVLDRQGSVIFMVLHSTDGKLGTARGSRVWLVTGHAGGTRDVVQYRIGR